MGFASAQPIAPADLCDIPVNCRFQNSDHRSMIRCAPWYSVSGPGIIPMPSPRRSVMKLAAAAAALAGSGMPKGAWAQTSPAVALPLGELPNLDGELLFGEAERQTA